MRAFLGAVAVGCACASACGTDPDPPPPIDPCAELPPLPGGAVELGLGIDFTTVADGETITVQAGAQGLWMFVINARAGDMDLGSGELAGAIYADAFDDAGTRASLDVGCRVREFAPASDERLQLADPYFLALDPRFMPIDGVRLRLRVEVRDHDGRRAVDERTIIAHQPP